MDASTRRFVTFVVVLMVVLAGLVGALFYIWDPIDPPPDEWDGWEEDQHGYYVAGEATWSDWDIRLDKSVNVEFGGDLRIVNSRIVVPLERLALGMSWFGGAFIVDEMGSLTIEDSEIIIEADPRTFDAWINAVRYHGEIPHFWRVVDLRNATMPTLELDVKDLNGTSTLAVGAQATPEAELELLATFGSKDFGAGEWVHLEVPLDDLKGGTPRLVVWMHESQPCSTLVSGVRVVDGDGPLEADPMPAGDLLEDGWYVEAIGPFGLMASLQDLIKCWGDLAIEGSVISSVPGLMRDSYHYRPHRFGGYVRSSGVVLSASSKGAGINVSYGTMTVSDSNLSYVPCEAMDSLVDVNGSGFVGDDEMLTLYECSGSVAHSRFEFDPGQTDRGTRSWDELLWQVAVEESQTRNEISIDFCTFVATGSMAGSGIGLHTNWMDGIASYCSFEGLEIAYWVHGHSPSTNWQTINRTMSFGNDCEYWYLETAETRIEFDGPGVTDYNTRVSWERLEFLGGPELPIEFEARVGHNSYEVAAPLIITGPGIGYTRVEELTIYVGTYWPYQRRVAFDPGEPFESVWIDEAFGNPFTTEFWPRFRPGSSPGRVKLDLAVYVDTYGRDYEDYRVVLDIDEDMYNFKNVSIDVLYYTTIVNISTEVELLPGSHLMSYQLIAERRGTESEVLIGEHITMVARATEEAQGWDTGQLMMGNSTLLLLDPGADPEGLRFLINSEDHWYHLVYVVAWEDSRVVLEEVVEWGRIEMILVASGPGEVVVRDVRVTSFYAVFNETKAVFDGEMDVGYEIDLNLNSSEVQMMGEVRSEVLNIDVENGSRLEMNGCGITVDYEANIWALDSSVHIDDCVFSRGPDDLLMLGISVSVCGNSVVDLDGCTFDQVPLDVQIWDANVTMNVRGCEFNGPMAYMFLLGMQYSDEPYKSITLPASGGISGNRFFGEGAGLIFDPLARDGLLGQNEFSNGALALAFYTPVVTYVTSDMWFRYLNSTTSGGWEFIRSGVYDSFWDWRTDLYQFMVDVTSDPLDDADPGFVPVTVRDMGTDGNWKGVVIQFTKIRPAEDTISIQVLEWQDIHDDLRARSSDIDSGIDWWSEGGQ